MGIKEKEVETRWTTQETDFLVDRYITEKPIIQGALSATLTKKDKDKAWERIVQDLNCSFPTGDKKTTKCTKKKWTNVLRYSRKKIQEYKSSISGTGGGKQCKLKPLDEKIMNQIIGRDNPALSGNSIPEGALETEDLPNQTTQSDSESDESATSDDGTGKSPHRSYEDDSPSRWRPSPGRLSDMEFSPPTARLSQLEVVAIENPVTGKIDALSKPRPLKDCLGTGKDSRASPIATSSAKKRKTNEQPKEKTSLPSTSNDVPIAPRPTRISNAKVSASVRRAKVTTCEVSEQLARKKLLKARLDVMKTIEETRKVRGEEKLSEFDNPMDLWEMLTSPVTAQL